MSIGAAVSIRVGYRLGEGNVEGARVSSRVGLLLGLVLAMITAIATVMYRENIALLYTQNAQVIELAVILLLFAAIYQCADSIQVIAAGALRGYKDMRAIFYCTFIAYWLLGLPIGFVLARTNWLIEPLGAQGFWLGFIVGLTAAAILLGLRLRWIHKQPPEVQLKFSQQ